MLIVVFYILAVLALAIGMAAIYMALLESFPLRWLYWHYGLRKPLVWGILLSSAAWAAWIGWQEGAWPLWSIAPLMLMVLAVVLAYRLHQESVFRALDNPPMAEDPLVLPLGDDVEMAVVEHGGVTKAYALDHLIHHHIVNDRFGDRIVALSYCAMCRTVIPFDVTEIGPLFVASFKNANMILGDRRTHTFFQQATFESVIGALHPYTLAMLPFQQLSWRKLKELEPMPLVARVTDHDLRAFELPVPGVWKRIMNSEATPGLSAQHRDRTLPARTRVIGLLEEGSGKSRVWIKSELLAQGLIEVEPDIILVAVDGMVNGFRSNESGKALSLTLSPEQQLCDDEGKRRWDLRGKALVDGLPDLTPVPISDEYWFSWKRFHPETVLLRL